MAGLLLTYNSLNARINMVLFDEQFDNRQFSIMGSNVNGLKTILKYILTKDSCIAI